MKSIPRLERELTDEIIALRQRINVQDSVIADLRAMLIAVTRTITDWLLEEPDASS